MLTKFVTFVIYYSKRVLKEQMHGNETYCVMHQVSYPSHSCDFTQKVEKLTKKQIIQQRLEFLNIPQVMTSKQEQILNTTCIQSSFMKETTLPLGIMFATLREMGNGSMQVMKLSKCHPQW